jgi:cardiolipin synthase
VRRSKKKTVFRRLVLVSFIFLIVFFTDWLATRAIAVELPLQEETFLYSNQTGTDLHLLFCEALSQAQHSIFLEMYAITDPSILRLLKNQVAQGKNVIIYADKNASPGLKRKLPAHLYEGKGLMHRKIVVLDDELVLLGSTNFTTSSLKMHDNLVLATKNHDLARFCQQNAPPWIYNTRELKVWKLPESGKDALDACCSLLETAKRTIRVAMFTFTHMRLAQELVNAKNRGIKVEVALDHYTREGSSKKVADFLEASGVPVYVSQGVQLLHHKWALIDDEILIAGSANWTQSAFKKNKDLLFVLYLQDLLKERMQALWKEIRLTANAA